MLKACRSWLCVLTLWYLQCVVYVVSRSYVIQNIHKSVKTVKTTAEFRETIALQNMNHLLLPICPYQPTTPRKAVSPGRGYTLPPLQVTGLMNYQKERLRVSVGRGGRETLISCTTIGSPVGKPQYENNVSIIYLCRMCYSRNLSSI